MTSPTDASLPTIEVKLRDGTIARIRPIQPIDKPLLAEGLSHMSLASRFARFGFGIDHLSEAELEYLTELDLVNHVAWGATVNDEPVASARYIKHPDDECAEFAVAVIDQFQRRGLGRILFEAIVASARHNCIECLSFWTLPTNEAVLKVMSGIDSHLEEKDGLVLGRIQLKDVPAFSRDEEIVELLTDYRKVGPITS